MGGWMCVKAGLRIAIEVFKDNEKMNFVLLLLLLLLFGVSNP